MRSILSGKRIGFVHTYVSPVKDRGRSLVRVRVDMETTFKREKDVVTTKMRFGTIETPEGEVLRMDSRIQASSQEMRTFGDVINNQMKIILEGAGQRQELTIPWGNDIRGPYAAEQSFSRKPMTAGETRTLKMFMPELNKVCDLTLAAKRAEPVQTRRRQPCADADRADDRA